MEETDPWIEPDWEAILQDAGSADREDTIRLFRYLTDHGATGPELAEAARAGTLGPLALELALRPAGERVAFDRAAEQAGLEVRDAAAVWRDLGFPDPLDPILYLTPREVQTLQVLAGMRQLLPGPDTARQLARVIGSSMAQLAEAIVDAFRVDVEMPRRDRGEPVSHVVEDYAKTAADAIPLLTDVLGDVLTGHMLAVSRASWALDERRIAVTRELAVGFADLVEFTRTARALPPAELAAAIASFESRMGGIISRHRGRVVKLIGDEVMFVIEDLAGASRLAVDLIDELSGDALIPRVRVGLAAGPVTSHRGDYYGDVVNLAARLVKVADPGEALLSEAIAEHVRPPYRAEPVELPALKGYDRPPRAYALTRRDET